MWQRLLITKTALILLVVPIVSYVDWFLNIVCWLPCLIGWQDFFFLLTVFFPEYSSPTLRNFFLSHGTHLTREEDHRVFVVVHGIWTSGVVMRRVCLCCGCIWSCWAEFCFVGGPEEGSSSSSSCPWGTSSVSIILSSKLLLVLLSGNDNFPEDLLCSHLPLSGSENLLKRNGFILGELKDKSCF